MLLSIARPYGIPVAMGLMLALAACKAVTETEEPIDWKISWQPATTHQDNTPLTTQPTYELEMADGESEPRHWKVVWSGPTRTAVIKAPPGHRCFRAITVENGVRSEPSRIDCATKPAAK